MKYKISKKINEKWFNFGYFETENKFKKPSESLYVTKELKDLINNAPEKTWLNLSAFEDKPKDTQSKQQTIDDEVPF